MSGPRAPSVRGTSRGRLAVRALLLAAVLVGWAWPAGVARAAAPWDDVGFVILPSWRLGPSFHVSTLPGDLTLCTPQNRSCPALQTLPAGSFHRGPVRTNAIDFGADLFAWGPLRVGIEGSYGAGAGPATRLGTQAISGSWTRTGGGGSVALRLRGPAWGVVWAGYAEVLPGFIGLTSSLQGPTINDQQVVASDSAFTLGGRLGLGVILAKWFAASVFGGAGFGELQDVSVGLRLELRLDAIHY